MKDEQRKRIEELGEDPFAEYLKIGEPSKAYVWQTAVGQNDTFTDKTAH